MKVLLVEDNLDLQATIGEYLELHDIEVDFSDNLSLAQQLISEQHFDTVILDVNLPDGSGFDLCHSLRSDYGCQSPILFLSARDTIEDKIEGFERGADDYLTKPFAMPELLMRIKALASRGVRSDVGVLKVGDVVIDSNLKRVQRGNSEILLNPIEFKILFLLARKSPNVVGRFEIENEVWGDESPESDKLRSHIHRLRRKLDKPFDSQLIHNIHGVGFSLMREKTDDL